MVASISCPFSSFTLNMALDKASMIVPSCLIRGCFDIIFSECKGRSIRSKKEITPIIFRGYVEKGVTLAKRGSC
jgi:hypothetical protein